MEWIENTTPQVYAGIIDEIGKHQYSRNVTWLREYFGSGDYVARFSIDNRTYFIIEMK